MIDGVTHSELLAYATRLVGRDAEDLVQDAYVRMLTTRSPFLGTASKQTWACAIVKRLAAYAHRRAHKHPAPSSIEETDAPSVQPSETSLDATRAIERLDAEAQLFLAAWDGSAKATADTLGWNRWRMRRVIARIRLECADVVTD
jgi:DNA-directed RNA polymerase specialized sigma24 family protein